MAKVNEADKKLLKLCRITKETPKFTLLRKLEIEEAKLTYQLTKLVNMGLLKRTKHAYYKLTNLGKINK